MIMRAKKAKPGYRQTRRADLRKVVNDPTGGQRNFALTEERKTTGAFRFFRAVEADLVSARRAWSSHAPTATAPARSNRRRDQNVNVLVSDHCLGCGIRAEAKTLRA
jgi:hypothetical protein